MEKKVKSKLCPNFMTIILLLEKNILTYFLNRLTGQPLFSNFDITNSQLKMKASPYLHTDSALTWRGRAKRAYARGRHCKGERQVIKVYTINFRRVEGEINIKMQVGRPLNFYPGEPHRLVRPCIQKHIYKTGSTSQHGSY